MDSKGLGLWLVCVCGAVCISARHFSNGGVLGRTRALRDDSRFLGIDSTVPVRLVYRTDSEQTAHDVLSTRVRASPITVQKNHLAQASFQVKAFNQTFILDLELNHVGHYRVYQRLTKRLMEAEKKERERRAA